MNEVHRMWEMAAVEVASYRQMYELALEITHSDLPADQVRRAARRVVATLEDVIDMPIADAKVLARARKRYRALVKALAPVVVQDSRTAA